MGKHNQGVSFDDPGVFLSRKNPTATADQLALEKEALQLLDAPLIKAATAHAALRFRLMAGGDIPDEAQPRFETEMREWTMRHLLLSLNGDANYPIVNGHGYGPPHEWFGLQVPGCRGPGTVENSDNHYSFVPVSGDARFVLHGRTSTPRIGDCPIYVCSNPSVSLNVSGLEWRDLQISDDGRFSITIDPEPANGRPNHLQTSMDTRYLTMRDSRLDWSEMPNAYVIERLDPPKTARRSLEQRAEVAARMIVDEVPLFWFFRQTCAAQPRNVLSNVTSSAAGLGGMPSQKLLRGRVFIEHDEAYVLHVGAGGAKYWALMSYDWWGMSGDFWDRPTCLNNKQSLANPDGTHTYVFSSGDPGVHNWIDTLGRKETLFLLRWHVLPQLEGGVGGDPWAKGQVVKLRDLDQALDETTRRVNAAERQQQLRERRASFDQRYAV